MSLFTSNPCPRFWSWLSYMCRPCWTAAQRVKYTRLLQKHEMTLARDIVSRQRVYSTRAVCLSARFQHIRVYPTLSWSRPTHSQQTRAATADSVSNTRLTGRGDARGDANVRTRARLGALGGRGGARRPPIRPSLL